MLETAIASGICAMGGRVMLCGPMPTPAVAHLTVSMRADAGIVISASHNPYQDNGIKIFGADGFKLPDEEEAEIEQLMANDALLGTRPTGPGIGRATQARGRARALRRLRQADVPARPLARRRARRRRRGARRGLQASRRSCFSELGANVTAIGVKPNGVNINKDAARSTRTTCAPRS